MAKLKLNNNIIIDHTEDGWNKFKYWIDGTSGSLRYTWTEDEKTYTIVALDGPVARTCSMNKGSDSLDFENYYKNNKNQIFEKKTKR